MTVEVKTHNSSFCFPGEILGEFSKYMDLVSFIRFSQCSKTIRETFLPRLVPKKRVFKCSISGITSLMLRGHEVGGILEGPIELQLCWLSNGKLLTKTVNGFAWNGNEILLKSPHIKYKTMEHFGGRYLEGKSPKGTKKELLLGNKHNPMTPNDLVKLARIFSLRIEKWSDSTEPWLVQQIIDSVNNAKF